MLENGNNNEKLGVEVLGEFNNSEVFEAESNDDEKKPLEKLDISNIQKPKTIAPVIRKKGRADLAIVNTQKNGKRVKISKKVLEELDVKETEGASIDIAFTSDSVVLSKELEGIGETFQISKDRNIYSKDLVEEITDKFELDFTGVSTVSFSETEYQQFSNGCVVALVKCKR